MKVAAGVTDPVCSIADIVSIVAAAEPTAAKRGPYPKKRGSLVGSHFNDPAYWRDRADELRALAKNLKDPAAKSNDLGVRSGLRLAGRACRRALENAQKFELTQHLSFRRFDRLRAAPAGRRIKSSSD